MSEKLSKKPTMKERILETADRLFYLQGIRAVGVDTIAAEIGISKRTLYNHFPSKDALTAAYLERRFVQPRPSDKSPIEQILGTFDALERRFGSKIFAVALRQRRGRTRHRRSLRQENRRCVQESRRLWFRDQLRQLGVADPEGLATQLQLLVTARSRRIWSATIPRWHARRRKLHGCCWQMPASTWMGVAPRKNREA
jgi:AcrR family transcriptional regulator